MAGSTNSFKECTGYQILDLQRIKMDIANIIKRIRSVTNLNKIKKRSKIYTRFSLIMLLAITAFSCLRAIVILNISSYADCFSDESERSWVGRTFTQIFPGSKNSHGSPMTQKKLYLARRPARVIAGIFTSTKIEDLSYRAVYRELMALHFPRVCSLHQYKMAMTEAAERQFLQKKKHVIEVLEHCQFLYTFVVGANNTDTAPTEIVDDQHPILFDRKLLQSKDSNRMHDDLNELDVTLLNIRENVNHGKSQTWLFYASTIARELSYLCVSSHLPLNLCQVVDGNDDIIDYIIKIDSSTLLFMDKYFQFAMKSMTLYPFNTRTLGGTMASKDWWNKTNPNEADRFYHCSLPMRIYPSGHLYFVSTDLARDISSFAAKKFSIVIDCGTNKPFPLDQVLEHYEEYDVAIMAHLSTPSDRPLNFLMIPIGAHLWQRNIMIKAGMYKSWEKVWRDELERIKSIQNSTGPTISFNLSRSRSIFNHSNNNDSIAISHDKWTFDLISAVDNTSQNKPELFTDMSLKDEIIIKMTQTTVF